MADNIFKYDESMSFMENYNLWYDMNCKERSAWNEQPYTHEEGLKVFEEMYKVDHTN